MNISILHTTGAITCRPDTTLQREDAPLYIPDGIKKVEYSPILFARIVKAGKSIGAKFASRYYEAIGYGILLYFDGSEIFDKSSIVPEILYSKQTLEKDDNAFAVRNALTELYRCTVALQQPRLEAALSKVSAIVSQRIGDIVAIELQESKELEVPCSLNGSYCGNQLFDFEIHS